MRGALIGCLALGGLLSVACGDDEEFGCSEDQQCENAGIQGFCEGNGYCAFSDESCPSGRRYGDLAGGGLAGVCVQGDGGSSGGLPGTTTSASSTSTTSPSGTGGTDTGTPETGSSGGSSDAETTGAFSCPDTAVCTTGPLPGWSGPVVLSPRGCGASDPMFEAGTGLAPASACDCQCGGEALAECQYTLWGDAGCDFDPISFLFAANECQPVDVFTVGSSAVLQEDEGSAYCQPDPPTPAAIADMVAACEPTSLGTCEDGSACLEPPVGGAVCNWRDGVHDCPSPDDERTVLYRSATGAYDCGCQCGTASTAACEQLELFSDQDCTEAVASLSFDGTLSCTEASLENLSIGSARVPTGACEDMGSRNTPEPLQFDQEPTETEPVTLCCQ